MTIQKLRFAPIIRVSTEKQEQQGESLRTQKTQIKQYVKSLGGVIPEYCWKYSGQEHATSGWERTLLDKLLRDAEKDLFDAIIVVEPSRWSRDNQKSKEGLNIFRKNEIRFFVATMEYALNNPVHTFFISMNAEIGEMQAMMQAQSSIQNRIARAKRRIPTAGKLPYGRLYDKETMKWSIDPEKQEIIKQTAKRYLAGDNIIKIARDFGMSYSQLFLTLTKRSGADWPIHFKNEKVNIDEIVPFKIPPLLDKATIQAIKERCDKNITLKRENRKYEWLLNGFVFCGSCGYAFTGTPNHKKRLYYAHSKSGEGHAKCGPKSSIRAKELEDAVMLELVRAFGNPEQVQRAIERATPNRDKLEALKQEYTILDKESKSIATKKEKLVKAVVDDLLSDDEVKKQMAILRDRETSISDRLTIIETALDNTPDPEYTKRLSTYAGKLLQAKTKKDPKIMLDKSFKWKRRLLETILSGTDVEGKRLGVYVTQTGNKAQPWQFEIRGVLDNIVIELPLSDDYLEDTFHWDSDYFDIKEELNNLRIKYGWY